MAILLYIHERIRHQKNRYTDIRCREREICFCELTWLLLILLLQHTHVCAVLYLLISHLSNINNSNFNWIRHSFLVSIYLSLVSSLSQSLLLFAFRLSVANFQFDCAQANHNKTLLNTDINCCSFIENALPIHCGKIS